MMVSSASSKKMIKVLLVQYSLSGETSHATEQFLQGFQSEWMGEVKVVTQSIQPDPAFSFPWTFWDFFDVLPETLHATPWQRSVVKPIIEEEEEADTTSFDLLVLGWQTWYLSPSLPVRLALEDPHYQALLNQKCKQAVLIGTHRNMWHHASTRLCRSLATNCPNVKLVGDINFCQSSPFLVSVVETLQRQLQGKSGVGLTTAQDQAFQEGRKFAQHFQQQQQQSKPTTTTVYHGGTPWNPTLAFCESTFFPIKNVAAKIMSKFQPGSWVRKLVMMIYIPILLSAIVGLAPPILLIGNLKSNMKKKTF